VGGASLDIRVAHGATIIELFVWLDQTLLVFGVVLPVLGHGYDFLNGVGGVKRSNLAVEVLEEDLSASS
jgi:hypothetical protein